MVSHVASATPYGFQGQLIEIEGDISKGLPSVQIVGLGNKAIDESRDRVRSAIKNSLLDFPKGKIVILMPNFAISLIIPCFIPQSSIAI